MRKKSHEIYNLLLRLLMIRIEENLTDSGARHNALYDRLLMLRTDIYSNPAKDFTIKTMAAGVNLSESYLLAVYRETFGTTAIRDVIRSRTEHAKYLLKATDLCVKEIAGACGYHTDVHFMRQFKKMTGLRPSDYRNR